MSDTEYFYDDPIERQERYEEEARMRDEHETELEVAVTDNLALVFPCVYVPPSGDGWDEPRESAYVVPDGDVRAVWYGTYPHRERVLPKALQGKLWEEYADHLDGMVQP